MMLTSLTLDQLRILVTVEETGSFSAAGRKLRRVQSAVSQSVQALELAQNVQLFDRSARVPTLTEAGRVLALQARQVLRQADMFESVADAIASGLEPELTLAVDSFVPNQTIIESLQALRTVFPGLAVALFTEGLWAAERRVRDRSAAIGICAILPAAFQDLQSHKLLSVTLIPVVSPTHPLAAESRPITRDLLAEHVQLILTDARDPGGQSYGVVSPRTWRFVELARRLDFLVAGFGWATMPEHMVAPLIADGRLTELVIDDPGVRPAPIPIHAVHERSRPLRKAAEWFLTDLRRRFEQRYTRLDGF
jgi:DNA-binding transcriptional LysR family regulator